MNILPVDREPLLFITLLDYCMLLALKYPGKANDSVRPDMILIGDGNLREKNRLKLKVI